MMKKLLMVGLGDLGGHVLELLCSTRVPIKIVTSDIDTVAGSIPVARSNIPQGTLLSILPLKLMCQLSCFLAETHPVLRLA
jgi:hypothetical protein